MSPALVAFLERSRASFLVGAASSRLRAPANLSFVLCAGPLQQFIKDAGIVGMDCRKVLADRFDLVGVRTDQLKDIVFIANSAGGDFQFNQGRQEDVHQ